MQPNQNSQGSDLPRSCWVISAAACLDPAFDILTILAGKTFNIFVISISTLIQYSLLKHPTSSHIYIRTGNSCTAIIFYHEASVFPSGILAGHHLMLWPTFLVLNPVILHLAFLKPEFVLFCFALIFFLFCFVFQKKHSRNPIRPIYIHELPYLLFSCSFVHFLSNKSIYFLQDFWLMFLIALEQVSKDSH